MVCLHINRLPNRNKADVCCSSESVDVLVNGLIIWVSQMETNMEIKASDRDHCSSSVISSVLHGLATRTEKCFLLEPGSSLRSSESSLSILHLKTGKINPLCEVALR